MNLGGRCLRNGERRSRQVRCVSAIGGKSHANLALSKGGPSSLPPHPSIAKVDEQWERKYGAVAVNWFPGHMAKASKVIQDRIKRVDIVVEVRDARLPFASANPQLNALVGRDKARLVVFNKADLADRLASKAVAAKLSADGVDCLFTSGVDGTNLKELLARVLKCGHKAGRFKTVGTTALIVGMPNVGKSSLINYLRKQSRPPGANDRGKKVARVGATPGVTRQVQAFRISAEPLVYVVDSPGVMVPRVKSVCAGLKLALTAAVPDRHMDQELLVDYLLDVLNAKNQAYVSELGLDGPIASLTGGGEAMMEVVARRSGASGKHEDIKRRVAFQYILDQFRMGKFGRITLEDVT